MESDVRRICLTVAYDGTNYHGWQLQPGCQTIEAVLNRELSALLQEEIAVTGASRTDAGVHSYGNVAVFDTDTRIPAEKISYALNQRLPEDIRIQDSCEVPADFHPRFQKTVKTYEYRILNREFPLPAYRFNSHFTYRKLDVERMRQAAAYLIGEHDFQSFCAAGAQVKTTVRTIYALDVEKQGDLIILRITGNGFLFVPRLFALPIISNAKSFSSKINFNVFKCPKWNGCALVSITPTLILLPLILKQL